MKALRRKFPWRPTVIQWYFVRGVSGPLVERGNLR